MRKLKRERCWYMYSIVYLLAVLLSVSLLFTGCGLQDLKQIRNKEIVKIEEIGVDQEAGQADSGSGALPGFYYDESCGANYAFKTGAPYFSVYNGAEFEELYVKGVNVGTGKPGYFPGEMGITKEEYLSWFQQISDMNANTIRVYTMMMPCFYEALYEYNQTAEHKLYLFHGLWYDETVVAETGDAYELLDEASAEAENLVNIIHGDAWVEQEAGKAGGYYGYDVSPYVIGWILGIESDAYFVGTTNELHPDKTSYAGEYVGTEDATPYETFMSELADRTLSYEMKHYGVQRPVSWSNWLTADPMTHPNEPDPETEDAVSIDVDKIKATEKFPAGVFASYHVYPYYPEFMMSEEYTENNPYVNEDGAPNTYRAYLEDLTAYHTSPVLVAEYGIPSSRGCTHVNDVTGFDQGGVNEDEQGRMLIALTADIYASGCAGGLIFTWQDEWFKRTWNTMDYSDPTRRPYWSDIQTSEQNYGLLAFDPTEGMITIDGNDGDWKETAYTAGNDDLNITVQKDARYLYFKVQGDGLDPEKDRILIPLDITPNSGSVRYEKETFERPADFVIDLNGREDSKVMVQCYYDRYAFFFHKYDVNLDITGYDDPDGANFTPIYLSLRGDMIDQSTGEWLDAKKYETGKLCYGNSDPKSGTYDSLADFCYGEDFVELRIPWLMLNFRDPSTKQIEDDFHAKGEAQNLQIEEIFIGASWDGKSTPTESFTWENWDYAAYRERRKNSYYDVQKAFAGLK